MRLGEGISAILIFAKHRLALIVIGGKNGFNIYVKKTAEAYTVPRKTALNANEGYAYARPSKG